MVEEKEKIKGTRDDYHIVWSNDYILGEGQQEPIITEEIWNKAQEKDTEQVLGLHHLLVIKRHICYQEY